MIAQVIENNVQLTDNGIRVTARRPKLLQAIGCPEKKHRMTSLVCFGMSIF
jgi:hypothetical protein